MIIALLNARIISDGQIIQGKAVLIEGKSITGIVNEADIPADADKIDLKGNFLAPGLIDLQIYGTGGKLFAGKPEEAALEQMENDMLRQGTTGFFATIGTNSNDINCSEYLHRVCGVTHSPAPRFDLEEEYKLQDL